MLSTYAVSSTLPIVKSGITRIAATIVKRRRMARQKAWARRISAIAPVYGVPSGTSTNSSANASTRKSAASSRSARNGSIARSRASIVGQR